MSTGHATGLENLLRANDLGWMIDLHAPPERAVETLSKRLSAAERELQARLRCKEPLCSESLEAAAVGNPHKVRAFLQALAASGNPTMLVMVWRILQGLSIDAVRMEYGARDSFSLTVRLARSAYEEGADPEIYETRDIADAALLRHFGIAKVDGRPLFDGFFPMGGSIPH